MPVMTPSMVPGMLRSAFVSDSCRPLKRAIQNEVLNALAELLIEGKAAEGDAVHVVVVDNHLDFEVATGKATEHFKEQGKE